MQGDLDGAIADCTRAIEIDPRGPIAYAVRGLARLGREEDAEAEQDFTKCLELDGSLKRWIEREAEEIGKKRAR